MMDEPDVAVDWPLVWGRVATTLSGHLAAGRAHLLTEDTVRMGLILALQSAGVAPSRMAVDVPSPRLSDGVADLVVDGIAGAVVDLKYPRETTQGGARDTQTMGVLLRDFLRLAMVPAGQRWVVQVLNARLMGYLRSAAERNGLSLPALAGERVVLERETLEWLPPAALVALGDQEWLLPVTATCAGVWPIAGELALFAFEVESPDAGAVPLKLVPHAQPEPDPQDNTPAPAAAQPSPAGSARAQVIEALRALARGGRTEATVTDVVGQLQAMGSRFGEPTVHTLLTTHMCVDVKGRGIASYDDVERVGDERYRLLPGR